MSRAVEAGIAVALLLVLAAGFVATRPACPPRSVAVFQLGWYCLVTVERLPQ